MDQCQRLRDSHMCSHATLPGTQKPTFSHRCLVVRYVIINLPVYRRQDEVDIYGTGGMILQDMKDLLVFLPGLKRLELTGWSNKNKSTL